jgi:hypothetical protein
MENNLSDIDTILEQCLEAIQNGTMSVEQCLQAYPEYQEELEPLLNLTHRLLEARELKVSPEFRLAALGRFKARSNISRPVKASPWPIQTKPVEQLKAGSPAARPAASSQPRQASWSLSFSISLVVVFCLALLTAGVGLAAQGSLPGGAFYPVKLAMEKATLTMAGSEVSMAELHLAYAERRLVEIDQLLWKGQTSFLPSSLEDFNQHVAQVATQITPANLEQPEWALLASQFMNSAATNEAYLQGLADWLPTDQRSELNAAITMARQARQSAGKVIAELPELRKQIIELLQSTLVQPTTTPYLDGRSVAESPSPTSTALPGSLQPTDPYVEGTYFVEARGLEYWLTNTPDWSRIATEYPSLYPTLANLATRLPELTATPRPFLRPTRVRPNSIIPTYRAPTQYPTPPVLPTR